MEGKTLGQRLREVRTARGLTTRQMADLVGISQAYVSQMEREKVANVSKKTVFAICAKLGLSEHWLLTGEGEMNTPSQPVVIAPPSAPVTVGPIIPKTTWRYRALEWLAHKAGYRLVVPPKKGRPKSMSFPGMTYVEAVEAVRALPKVLNALGFNPFEDAAE